MTLAEAHAAARRASPHLGLATLYRAVNALVSGGELTPVALPGEPLRYQRTINGHHHFFRCDECHRVFRVPGCQEPAINRAPKGFSVKGHQVTLYGACADCAAPHAPAAKSRTPSHRPARKPAAKRTRRSS